MYACSHALLQRASVALALFSGRTSASTWCHASAPAASRDHARSWVRGLRKKSPRGYIAVYPCTFPLSPRCPMLARGERSGAAEKKSVLAARWAPTLQPNIVDGGWGCKCRLAVFARRTFFFANPGMRCLALLEESRRILSGVHSHLWIQVHIK